MLCLQSHDNEREKHNQEERKIYVSKKEPADIYRAFHVTQDKNDMILETKKKKAKDVTYEARQ